MSNGCPDQKCGLFDDETIDEAAPDASTDVDTTEDIARSSRVSLWCTHLP